MDPVSVYNPSVIQEQYNPDDDEEDAAELQRIEEEEQRELEKGVEAEMANMTGPNFDDSEEESVLDDQNQAPEGAYAVHVPQPMGHSYANPRNYSETDERQILYGQESGHLQVLYHARGEEMSRLNDQIQELNAKMEGDSRSHMHQITLLKQQNGKLESNCEHFESIAKAQSEENAKLRQDLELIKGQNTKSYNENCQLKSEIESQNMMVQTLQFQIQELQRSDTILRAKTQHEEKLRSLKDRHESEMFQMQQQIDKLESETRKLDAEKEVLNSKLRKNQSEFDKINLEKSDTIKNLQERLDLSQRKIDQIQASKSTYTDGTEMFKRYQMDKEKFAIDLCDKQEEIERLKSQLKAKIESLENSQKVLSKLKIDFENQIGHKDNLISSLNQRLNESERKISELMRESLTGSTNAAVRRLNDELEKVKTELSKKDLELVTVKTNLNESKLKYSDFKKRVKVYQNDRKRKEEKLKEYIKESEEEFRAKLRAARDQLQADYDAKLSEVSLNYYI